MKFYKVIFLIISVIFFTCISALSETADKIIAVINDEAITQNELNAAFEPYRKRIEESYQGADKENLIQKNKAMFLQRKIDELLIEQEARKSGTNIKEEEVMEVLKDSLAKQNMKMEDLLKKLERDGNSLETVKSEIRGQLMRMRLMRREIKAKVIVGDQEIGDYYNQHREEYEGKEGVRIKQILLIVPPGADKTARMKIKKEALEIHQRAINGEGFDQLAAKYSQGPAAAQGGDIGFIERGVTIPELEKAAFSLSVDQMSGVIESSLGFHILKAVDKRGAGLKPIAAVREEIKIKLEDEMLEKKYDEWITSLRKKSHVEIR